MSEWTKIVPSEIGEYAFCIQGSRHVRCLRVFSNARCNDRRLYTNEDGGALVTDEMYEGDRWMRLPDRSPLPKPPENP